MALSVVGTDRLLASGYFRAKLAQENLIKASSIPYTIVRATQFFEFVGGIAQAATQGQTVRLPAALMQPVVSDDVAAVMADAALAEPVNGTVELAGPEPIRQDELVRQFLRATGDPRTVVTDASALYFGIAVDRPKPNSGRKPSSRSHPFQGLARPQHQINTKPTKMTAIDPAQNPKVEHRIREFLKALNSGGGKAIETLTPAEARQSPRGCPGIGHARSASLRHRETVPIDGTGA